MAKAHFDTIIIGAGISGISAAYHVQRYHPQKTFRIFERREQLGGTWDLFNYPGIRSDSDMYTFGFNFRHWRDDSAIAKKSKILSYLNDTVNEFDLAKHIQYQTGVVSASWSSTDSSWLLTTTNGDQYSCHYVFMCTGYYNYEQAHEPQLQGIDEFSGEVVHPQFWPENFDYEDKNVVVLGSGATAVTMLPAMADKAKHVTMLQRSPTYMGAKPAVNPMANRLAKYFGRWAARWWFISTNMLIYWYCRAFPERAKAKIIADIKKELGDKFEAKHYSPNYKPWDQRLCLCPDGDFFDAIKAGKASVETDQITGFDTSGIALKSGKHLAADVIVTATGLMVWIERRLKSSKGQREPEFYLRLGRFSNGVIMGFPLASIAIFYLDKLYTGVESSRLFYTGVCYFLVVFLTIIFAMLRRQDYLTTRILFLLTSIGLLCLPLVNAVMTESDLLHGLMAKQTWAWADVSFFGAGIILLVISLCLPKQRADEPRSKKRAEAQAVSAPV